MKYVCRFVSGVICSFAVGLICNAQERPDFLREFQFRAAELDQADWIHWGDRRELFSGWKTHSNRLTPVYSFGISLKSVQGESSCYRDEERLTQIYGQLPESTVDSGANYFDQTDIYHLLGNAWKVNGKKHLFLIVFDGMDWQTTQAAAIYKQKTIPYVEGRGSGLSFLDYKEGDSEFGYCVTSPNNGTTKFDVDAQVLVEQGDSRGGGYSSELGGRHPWSRPNDPSYLLGRRRSLPHPYTDSAASATSLNTGRKTYNGSINIGPDGEQLETLAHELQRNGYSIGVVTNVPISHATPACVYAHNVTRNDYQDLTRDLLGLRSVAHRHKPLPGVDVLIGCGWGETSSDLQDKQGMNYVPGNTHITEADLADINIKNGGKYVVAQRTAGDNGNSILSAAAEEAATTGKRLFGYFGVEKGHLPFQTADGSYNPTRGSTEASSYEDSDISENPTLADMANAALTVLATNDKGFFLMVEAGDVDWANHNNNIDDAIGAVFSGDDAFLAVVNWVEQHSNWEEAGIIVTADHGHMMVLDDPKVLTGKRPLQDKSEFEKLRADKYHSSSEEPL